MKTIKRVLAATIGLMLICAPCVFCCDWGYCDDEYINNANSLLSRTYWDNCFYPLASELGDLCDLYGPTCRYPRIGGGRQFRQDLTELGRILERTPSAHWKLSRKRGVEVICRLICKHPTKSGCCDPDLMKRTYKLMKLMSPKQGNITLLGTFKATKEGHKGVASNRLLDILGRSPYHRYITLRLALATGQLIKAADKSNTTLLMLASAMGRLKVAEELLANDKNVNAQNKSGKTALIFAASQGHAKVVEALLKAGADPKLKDKDGDTAASLAKKKGRYDVLEILGQASVRKQDKLSD